MPQSQNLIIGTTKEPTSLIKELCKTIGHDVDVKSVERYGRVDYKSQIPNFHITAKPIIPTGWNVGYLENHFTLATGWDIVCYHREYNDYEADTELLQMALQTIEKGRDVEIILYFQDLEQVVLAYDGKRLVLNSLFNIWDENRLKLVEMSYEFKEILYR
jgi:hypothetical protein